MRQLLQKTISGILLVLLLVGMGWFGVGVAEAQAYTIRAEHPRIWWTPERLARAQDWYSANPFSPGSDDPWGNALRYVLTGEVSYARTAINSLMNFTISQGELDGVASDRYRWNNWVPVVFDWCYNEMTQDERQTFIDRYNGYVDIMRQKYWGRPGMDGNNYYWGYFRNELNWAIASYYHSIMAQTFLDWALVTRWQDSFLPYAAGPSKGGVPPEGSQYGRYMLEYPIIPLKTMGLLGRDLFEETGFYKEALFYLIYATTPSPTVRKGSNGSPYYQVFPFNDDETYQRYPSASNEHYGDFMTVVANQWSELPLGKYARKWLNMVNPPVTRKVAAVDQGGTDMDFSTLPLDYYAPGIKYLYARSNWGPQATVINLQLGSPVGVGHYHLDSGTFQIWRNGRWLSKESTGYSEAFVGGRALDTISHNGIIFEGRGLVVHTYRDGLPEVLRLESSDDYDYAVVDLSGAYRAHSRPSVDNVYVARVLREFVFIKPLETMIILDRLESTDELIPAEDVVKTFLVHFPEQPQTEGPNSVIGINGDQALYLTTLIPETPSYNIVDEGSSNQYRLEVNTSGQRQSYFLHVLRARDTDDPDVDPVLIGDATSFTINLGHPSLGYAVVVFNKGMDSVGGAIGYSESTVPSELALLIDRVHGIEVTDSGPVWEGTLPPEPDTTPPSTPTSLNATAVSSTQIDLSWLASTDDVGVLGYKIYRSGTQIATASNTSYQDTELSPSTNYTYAVSAYDASGNESGQSAQTSATTLDNDPPTASASANPTSGQAPLTVNFTGSGSDTDGNIVSYSWDFGDGNTLSQQNPSHTYNNAGNYIATLTVTDDDGATGSSSVNTTVTSAGGTVYYVDPNGSDSNPGTQTQPWRTLQKAANTVGVGSTVLVNNGTYSGFYTVRSGSSSNPITFKANGSNVVINSRNSMTADNINVEGTDYIVIDGFIVRNAGRSGIRVVTSRGVVVRNCIVSDNYRQGIFSGFAPEIRILDNIVSGSIEQHGIYISNSNVPDDDPVIRGNESFGNNQNGIQLNGDLYSGGDGMIEGAIIENNTVHDNGWKGLSLISMSDSIVRNNLIYNNGITAGAGGTHIVEEPGTGKHSSRNLVVNNTIVEPRIAAIRINAGNIDNIVFNNIGTGRTNPIVDEDGSNYIDTNSNLTQISTTGLFVNDVAGDYHLADNSPAIDAGAASYQSKNAPTVDIEGNGRPQGAGYDIGAYEYPVQGIRGDVNRDGLVNVVDVQLAVNQFLGIIPQTSSADLNGDGVVNVIDVQQLVNIILGG